MKMKYFNKIIAGVLAISALMVSCDKYDVNEGITSKEKSLIKLPAATSDISTVAVDAVAGQVSVPVLEVRKDAISEADLAKGQDIKITKNTSLITAYNAAHGTSFEEFSGFTAGDGSTFDGNVWTLPFTSGDFVKYINLKFDPTTLDLSKKYAIGFEITDAGGAAISSALKEVVVEIAIKNAYHGTYSAVGVFHHPTAGDRVINELKLMSTNGPKSVIGNLADLGSSGYRMILTVNADNTVTIGKAGATPDIDQHWGPNYYDPITKSFHLHYSYNIAAPRIVEETLTLQ